MPQLSLLGSVMASITFCRTLFQSKSDNKNQSYKETSVHTTNHSHTQLSPYTATIDWPLDECGSACDGLLISMSFKLVILLVGAFALFQADASRRRRHMPRVHTARLLVYALAAALLVAYWLFYCARIVARRERNHASIALFATQLADTLIWLHYAALVLFELRPLLGAADYVVEVLRSPDAESHAYTLGRMSLQECAATVLERYYCDFAVYNPYLEKAKGAASSSGSRRQQRFKLYDIDGKCVCVCAVYSAITVVAKLDNFLRG